MAKKKKAEETDLVVAELSQEKPLLIVQGSLPDTHCNYGIQINTGPTKGMVHNVKGKPNIVLHDDLREAFQKFRPHLASLCDKVNNDECENFGQLCDRMEVDLCHVTGFKIKGAGESESICLVGSYHSMNAQGRIECVTNFISLEGHDGYKWYNELRDAADIVRKPIRCKPKYLREILQ